jgi:hypothetical protein
MKKKELKKAKKELSFEKVTVLELDQLRQIIGGGDGGGATPHNQTMRTIVNR